MMAGMLAVASVQGSAGTILLPVTDHLPLLGGFMAVVIGLLVADLTLFHRNPKPVGWLAAAGGVSFWVVLALLFNAGLFVFIDGWLRAHPQQLLNAGLLTADELTSDSLVALAASNAAIDLSVQWLASYVIEMSLSVDNLFVFVIIMARFAPIVRTFVPVVAGMAGMRYRDFAVYNIVGGVAWISSMSLLGYFLGGFEIVKKHTEALVLLVIFVSILPGFIEWWRIKRAARKAEAANQPPEA